MANSLKLSVVIATYNRAETLRETLRHIIAQELEDLSAIEVVVSDDGSPDHTGQIVREARVSAPFEIRYVRHDNHGIGYTQNQGLRTAQAPLVLLIADDILLSPQAVSTHLKAHEVHSEQQTAILGRVVQSPQLTQSL
jgi:glycosyltransferase involved in cell wall biosynthesis